MACYSDTSAPLGGSHADCGSLANRSKQVMRWGLRIVNLFCLFLTPVARWKHRRERGKLTSKSFALLTPTWLAYRCTAKKKQKTKKRPFSLIHPEAQADPFSWRRLTSFVFTGADHPSHQVKIHTHSPAVRMCGCLRVCEKKEAVMNCFAHTLLPSEGKWFDFAQSRGFKIQIWLLDFLW